LKINSENVEVIEMKADVYKEMGNVKKAIELYEKVVALSEENEEVKEKIKYCVNPENANSDIISENKLN